MTTYLVIHTPIESNETDVKPPTDLVGLATHHGKSDAAPRWLKAWSPDLSDDRIFSLWEAKNAGEIVLVLERFGFLDQMDYAAIPVNEWGPEEILATQDQGNE
ncbi:MAG: hypothetical protein M9947_06380 [Thermomicrobiales bacterium]|nr:hypothetical protein [Thermomicrobiales bacterium]